MAEKPKEQLVFEFHTLPSGRVVEIREALVEDMIQAKRASAGDEGMFSAMIVGRCVKENGEKVDPIAFRKWKLKDFMAVSKHLGLDDPENPIQAPKGSSISDDLLAGDTKS